MKLKILFLSCIAMQLVAMDPATRAKITELARRMAETINSAKIRHDIAVGSNSSLPTFRDVGVGPDFTCMRPDTQKRLLNLVSEKAQITGKQAEALRRINPDHIILRASWSEMDTIMRNVALVLIQFRHPRTRKVMEFHAWIEKAEWELVRRDDFGILPLPYLKSE